MSKLVAIHWDQRQLLVATAQKAASSLLVDRVQVIALDPELDPQDQIADQLKTLGLVRGEATVVIGRSGVEIRQIDVPPVPADELPGLVRFQARSQFASLTEDSPLDFVPIAENGHVETVLAASISSQLVEDIKSVVEPGGLKLKHIVFRPFSTVELARSGILGDKCSIVVNYFQTEVDLTVARNGYVNLSRSIRITPPDGEVSDVDAYSAKIVLQEIRRTLAAASNQGEPVNVEQIVICGQRENHSVLDKLLQAEMELEVQFFHPFEAVKLRPSVKRNLPKHDGRFAPLLGSLVQQNSKDNHAVDFLNPRKPAVKSSSGRNLKILAIAAGVMFLMAGIYAFMSIRSLDSEITSLKEQESRLISENRSADQVIAEVSKVDLWTRSDVLWLEEIAKVSDRYLYPDDVKMRLFSGGVVNDQGTINTTGYTLDAETNVKLKSELIDQYNVDERNARYGEVDGPLKFDYQHVLKMDLVTRPLFVTEIPVEEFQASPGVMPQPSAEEGQPEVEEQHPPESDESSSQSERQAG